ncbi:SRPBCC domain-containing protein [Amycolatopsis sp. NPDC058986]|uniref:SRPBCC domain-containing protein n=1 Tax=unclassified Amycolatopsis TaxID=2618356 RepID=UPI00366FE90E
MTDTQVYRVYIRATPQAIWDAITKPEWTAKYGYTGLADYDLKPGGKFAVHPTEELKGYGVTGDMVDGEVIEADPPRKLVLTWKLVMAPEFADEPYTKLTYDIEETKTAGTRLTVTHDVTGAPGTAAMVSGAAEDINAPEGQNAGGGWNWILSDLKTLLETGNTLAS